MRAMLTESFAQTRTARAMPPMWGLCSMRVVLGSLALALLPGCGTMYIAQAAHGQWEVLHDRRPIDAVMSDARTPEALRARLAAARHARDLVLQQPRVPHT